MIGGNTISCIRELLNWNKRVTSLGEFVKRFSVSYNTVNMLRIRSEESWQM